MSQRRPLKPHADTQLAHFLQRRLLEQRPHKTQAQIASEVGWKTPNVLSMIASGATKMPIERVPALARALDVDPADLLRLTLAQHDLLLWDIIEKACGFIVTDNEKRIVSLIRELSRDSDPTPTGRLVRALREAFGQ